MIKIKKEWSWFYFSILILIITSTIKIIFSIGIPGPVIYGDELLYKKRAFELFYYHSYGGSSYPPMYPLVISLSFLFNDFYLIIKIINILLILIGNIFVFKICRLYLPIKESSICLLLVNFFPWQYITCNRIMSENLYYPLLLITIYVFLKISYLENIKCYYLIIMGMLLACLHLTRHITIVILPIFALFWFIDIKNNRIILNFYKKNIINGIVILSSYILIYGAWIIFRLICGEEISIILGLKVSGGIGKSNIQNYADLNTLLVFIILYTGYFCLSISYNINYILCSLYLGIKTKISKEKIRFLVLAVGITIMLMLAAIRHSWRNEYNYPTIAYIIGRYIFYLSAIWMIFCKIVEKDILEKTLKKQLLLFQFIEIFLITFSILILIKNFWFDMGNNFLSNFNTKDIYYIKYIWISVIVLSIIKFLIIIIDRKQLLKITNYSFIVTLIIGCLISFQYNDFEYNGIFGQTIYKLSKEMDLSQYSFIINDTPVTSIDNDIQFWDIDTKMIVINDINKEKKLSDFGLVFTEVSQDYVNNPYKQCEYKDKVYGVYEYPIKLKTDKLNIIQSYPDTIVVNKGFNVQSDGSSALAIQVNSSNDIYEFYINDQYLNDISINSEGIGSIIIPKGYFDKVGNLNIYIKQKDANKLYIQQIENKSPIYKIKIVEDK